MSRFRRIELVEPYSPPLFVRESSIFYPNPLPFPAFFAEEADFSYALDLLDPSPRFSSIEIEKTPSLLSYRVLQRRLEPDFTIQKLSDRVTALESRFEKLRTRKSIGGDRKYTVTAEIKGSVDRKYKWTAEIKDGERKAEEAKPKPKPKEKGRKYKWITEVEGKSKEGPISRKYTFEASSGDADEFSESEKKEKKEKKGKKEQKEKKEKKTHCETRVVEIEDPADHRTVVLRQAFAKRAGAIRNNRGKTKELSPQDAALMIQEEFRAYLIRRSKSLRALRELAIAKTKLKEIRALFNNFSYRRRLAREPEELQRFSEKIIVLLLTIDATEGSDLMVRSAKKSMVDELEAMLDVVDPQPSGGTGRSLSMKRRTFDMPDGAIQKEIAEGVAQVVQMLENEENSTFEACL